MPNFWTSTANRPCYGRDRTARAGICGAANTDADVFGRRFAYRACVRLGRSVLTSWNFRHIVHFEKIRQFTAVNIELGYKPLPIYSPREVTNYGEEKDV